jgi:hypothetical protein
MFTNDVPALVIIPQPFLPSELYLLVIIHQQFKYVLARSSTSSYHMLIPTVGK